MKRFYKTIDIGPTDGGFTVLLDGRAIRTPLKTALALPNEGLASAIAHEWAAQSDVIRPASMPLTKHANTVIDRISPQREAVIDEIARYGTSDLICYRADWPSDLAITQADTWDPLVAWANTRFDISLTLTSGILYQEQPSEATNRLYQAVASLTDWELAPLHTLTTILGSLIIALAAHSQHLDAEQAWKAGQLDELYQASKWGEDALAAQARANKKAEIVAAYEFLSLL